MKSQVPFRVAILVIVALVLIIIGQWLPEERTLGLDASALITDIGTFLLGLLVVQTVLDHKVRKDLVSDAVGRAVQGYKAVHKGVVDIAVDSRTTAGETCMDDGGVVVICFNHSKSLFDRIEPKLVVRSAKGFKTKVVLMRPQGRAMKHTIPDAADRVLASADVRRIKERIDNIEIDHPGCISVLYFDRVLSYIGMCSDEHAWMIPYTNSVGRAEVPALCFRRDGGGVHKFIHEDLARVVQASVPA
ncbi:MAG: hypothetical protein QME55_09205 [Brevundimonas sp.]|nr:hypothetical protein [Brevundimonas sp.]